MLTVIQTDQQVRSREPDEVADDVVELIRRTACRTSPAMRPKAALREGLVQGSR